MAELGPAVECEARSRLGLAEAGAFLARLETLSFDNTGPLRQVYGGAAGVDKFAAQLVLDALHAAAARPPELRRARRSCGGSTATGRSTRPGSRVFPRCASQTTGTILISGADDS